MEKIDKCEKSEHITWSVVRVLAIFPAIIAALYFCKIVSAFLAREAVYRMIYEMNDFRFDTTVFLVAGGIAIAMWMMSIKKSA